MRNWNWGFFGALIFNAIVWAAAIYLCMLASGCMMIWTDDALIIDGKDRDIDYFIVERDPNGFYMEAGKWIERAKNIEANYNPVTGFSGSTSSVP